MRPSTKRIIEEHALALEKIARDQRAAAARFQALRNVTCYKQSVAECDEEQHKCDMCGKTMCFSHSVQASGSWSDETALVCVDCVAR